MEINNFFSSLFKPNKQINIITLRTDIPHIKIHEKNESLILFCIKIGIMGERINIANVGNTTFLT